LAYFTMVFACCPVFRDAAPVSTRHGDRRDCFNFAQSPLPPDPITPQTNQITPQTKLGFSGLKTTRPSRQRCVPLCLKP